MDYQYNIVFIVIHNRDDTYTELLPPSARRFTFVNSRYSIHSKTDLTLMALSCANWIKVSSSLMPLDQSVKFFWKYSLLQYWHQLYPVLEPLHCSHWPKFPNGREEKLTERSERACVCGRTGSRGQAFWVVSSDGWANGGEISAVFSDGLTSFTVRCSRIAIKNEFSSSKQWFVFG